MPLKDLESVREHIASKVIGQADLVENMLICLLSDGHMLIEGMPGLAKSTAVSALSEAITGDFQRIQFTPDLLPSDLIGTDIYRSETGEFEFREGPLFHHILLADEINRAPVKVQSALLEAMAERQISVGQTTYKLPALFMVLATQNPVEQEGTYQLPEAQLDRFLMQVIVDYPSHAEELKILELDLNQQTTKTKKRILRLSQSKLMAMRKSVADIFTDQKMNRYIVDLVQATRNAHRYDDKLASWIRLGASPRASLAIARTARAKAWLEEENFVSPGHIQEVILPVLRHRILLSFEAEAEGITPDDVIHRLLSFVAIP